MTTAVELLRRLRAARADVDRLARSVKAEMFTAGREGEFMMAEQARAWPEYQLSIATLTNVREQVEHGREGEDS